VRIPLALVVPLMFLATACQADLGVAVDGHADGSGRVVVTATLDKEATAAAGPLALADLRQAGWTVDGPRSQPGGSTVVQASRAFHDAQEATAVVADVAGPSGPLREFRLSHRRSLLRTRTTFTGTVDLRAGLAAFGDDDLRRRLGGPGLGLDPAAVRQATGVDLDSLFRLTVQARLPGKVTSNAPATNDGAVWQPRLGQQVLLSASAVRFNPLPVLLLLAAGVALAAMLAALALRRYRRG